MGNLHLISVIFLELGEGCCTRGHSFKLKKRRINTDLRQHFFSERIVNIWNALDDDLVHSSSLNVFKNGLRLLWKIGRRTDCRWVSYSLLTYDPQRLGQSPW